MGRCWPAIAALGLLSCTPSLRFEVPELPAEADYLAAIWLSDSGEVLSGSGLVHRGDAGAFELTLGTPLRHGPTMAVVGYSASVIAGAGISAVDDGVLASAHLRPAAADETRLPLPAFAALGDAKGSGLTAVSPATLPALTADWLGTCGKPIFGPEQTVRADLDCTSCEAPVAVHGCRLSVDAARCTAGTLDLIQNGAGDFSIPNTLALEDCRSTAPAPPGEIRVTCNKGVIGPCALSIHALSPFPPVDLDRLDLFEEPSDTLAANDPPFRLSGYISGIAVLSDRIAVAVGRPFRTPFCGALGPVADLVMISLDGMTKIRTVSAPICLDALAPDLSGDGFFGAYRASASELRLGLFNHDGDLVRSASSASSGEAAHQSSIAVFPGTVVMASNSNQVPVPSLIEFFDPETLVRQARPVRPASTAQNLRNVFSMGGSKAGVINDSSDQLLKIDLNSGTLSSSVELSGFGSSNRVGQVTPLSANALFGSGGKPGAGYLFVTEGTGVRHHPTAGFIPYATAPWPADPSRIVVGLTSEGRDRAAVLRLVDPVTLYSSIDLDLGGGGQVGHIVSDAKGRLFVTLPWTGTLVRVTPR